MGLLSWIRGRRRRATSPASVPIPSQVTTSGQVLTTGHVLTTGRGLTSGQVLSSGGFVVVDVETTGLVAARDRIIEIAVVRTDASGNVLDEWSTLLNPDGPVGATRIHGITATDVRAAPRFAEVAGELTARLAGRVLVAHNARFDLGFIETEYARAGWSLPAVPYLCTLEASWTYLPELDRRRLSDCCWVCGIALHDAHSALGDARATAQLLATYLDPHTGEPPAPQHTTLPAAAA